MLSQLLIVKKMPLHIDNKQLPNKARILAVIVTLDPTNEIFQKGYLPPSREKHQHKFKTLSFALEILTGLRSMKSKTKRTRLEVVRQGKELETIEKLKIRKDEIA